MVFCLVLLLIMRILSNFNSLIHVTPRAEALKKNTQITSTDAKIRKVGGMSTCAVNTVQFTCF